VALAFFPDLWYNALQMRRTMFDSKAFSQPHIADRFGGQFSAAKGLMGACPHMRLFQSD